MPTNERDCELFAQSMANEKETSVIPREHEAVEQSGSGNNLNFQTLKNQLSKVLDKSNRSDKNSNEESDTSPSAPKKKKICELSDSSDQIGNQLDNLSNPISESNAIIMQIKEEIDDTLLHDEVETDGTCVFIGLNGETVRIKEEPVEPVSSEFVGIKQELEEPFIEPENVMVKIEEGTEDPLFCDPDAPASVKEEVEEPQDLIDQSDDDVESVEEIPISTVSDSDDLTEVIKEEVEEVAQQLPFTCDHDYEGRSRKSDGYVKVYTEGTLKAMALIANKQAAKAAELNEPVEPNGTKMNDLLVNLEGELNSSEFIKVYPDEYLRGVKPHSKFVKGNADPKSRVSDDIKLSILEEARANFTRVESPEARKIDPSSKFRKGINAESVLRVANAMKLMISNPEVSKGSSQEALETRGAKKFVKGSVDTKSLVSNDMKLSILEEAKSKFAQIMKPEMQKCIKGNNSDPKSRVSSNINPIPGINPSFSEDAQVNFNHVEDPEVRGVKQSKPVKENDVDPKVKVATLTSNLKEAETSQETQGVKLRIKQGNSLDPKPKVSNDIKLSIIEAARVNFNRGYTPEPQVMKPVVKFVNESNCNPKPRVSNDVKLSILKEAKANFSQVEASKIPTGEENILLKYKVRHSSAKKETDPLALGPSTSSQQLNPSVGHYRLNPVRRGRPKQNESVPLPLLSQRGEQSFRLMAKGLKRKKREQSLEEVVENMRFERKIATEQLAKLDEELKRRPQNLKKSGEAKGLTAEPNIKLKTLESLDKMPKKKVTHSESNYRVKEHTSEMIKLAERQLASLDKDTNPSEPFLFSPATPKARLGLGSEQERLTPVLLRQPLTRKKRRTSVGQQIEETQKKMEMERKLAEEQLAALSKGCVKPLLSPPPFSPLTPKARLKMGYVAIKPELKPRIPNLGQINPSFRPICPPSRSICPPSAAGGPS